MRAKSAGFLLAILFATIFPRPCSAHPMGNFSVNHYSKISLESDGIKVKYFIDLAEIPTYQELQAGNITATPNDPATLRFIATRGAEYGRGLTLSIDGKPLVLHLGSSGVIFPPGAGGLPTMKMGFVYDAAYPADTDRVHASLRFSDHNYEGHTGWKEIVATASAGSLLKSSVPQNDRSAELSNYPTDLLSSPPQDLDATLEAALPSVQTQKLQQPRAAAISPEHIARSRSLAPAAAPQHEIAGPHAVASPGDTAVSIQGATTSPTSLSLQANRQQTPRSRFTELIVARHLSVWFLFTAALIAMGLGALHAMEPGHGKTIVAAYLVGSRGTVRHAILLGLIVTASHTAGVFALGAITLYASQYIVPEQLYPWLGVLSGIIIAALGLYMLLRRWTGTASDHAHAPGENHGHWPSTKSATSEVASKQVSLVQLLTLGITGGIIPCPAALIVLLSAFALHRVGLGFFLIVAFSLGLAAVLIAFGLLMVYARRFMGRLQIDGPVTKQWLPMLSAAFICVLGLAVASQGLAAAHINLVLLWSHLHLSPDIFSKERLGPLLFVTGLGLILGMRHSTDADHVVAISTIVSKQRGIRGAALIGSIWGLGHTITIFIVGSLIILFDMKIPPRIGLSMEFAVALMLVLLGVLNLTGVLKKITVRFSRVSLARFDGAIPSPTGITVQGNMAASGLMHRAVARLGVYQCVRPLVIGLVHGLAGSAAVALLVLSTIHDPVWATFYLLIFGAGTMVGMMCMTAAMVLPLTYAGDRFAKVSGYMGVASGLVSLCFGSFLVYQLGFVGGLFTSHPQWTPR
jgi:ABC-type nickel/cobalt efflux system permease component RcnA/high-affinity nickel permease